MIMIMILIIIKDGYYKIEKIFMNTENSKPNEYDRFTLDLKDKLNLKEKKI